MVTGPTADRGSELDQLTAPRHRLLTEWWLVAIALTTLVLAASVFEVTRRFDGIIYDKLSRLDRLTVDPSVLIVAVDEQSLAEFGRWPWPRDVDATLVRAIQQGHPRAIIFDALFIEPSESDQKLASAMRLGAPVFLPVAFDVPGRNGRAFDLVKPATSLLNAAAGIGHVNLVASEDGVVRHVRLWDGDARQSIPQLMVTVLGDQGANFERDARSHRPMILPFAGPAGTYPTISAAAVLKGELPPKLLENKIVLIGATATGLNDWHPISADGGSGSISGVELQANLLAAIRQDLLIRDAPGALRAAFALVPLWLLLLMFRRFAPRAIVALMALLLVAVVTASAVGLIFSRIWLPPATPIIALMLAYPIWGWRRLATIHDFLISEIEQLSIQDGAARTVDKIVPLDPLSRRARLLRHAIDMMRQAQRQREIILQFLSHDMRAPQSLILTVLDAAPEGEIDPALAARIKGYAARTLELSDSFVRLARAESDAYRFEPVNLSDLLIEAIDHVWPLARKADVSVTSAGIDNDFLVDGDAAKLFRVLVNILLNAIRHSPPNTKVSCSLEIQLAGSARMVICSVQDEGDGVPHGRRERLFTPFLATDVSGRDANGIGLGLAFSHAVITRHRGRIWYEHGPGARFVIALPVLPPQPDPQD